MINEKECKGRSSPQEEVTILYENNMVAIPGAEKYTIAVFEGTQAVLDDSTLFLFKDVMRTVKVSPIRWPMIAYLHKLPPTSQTCLAQRPWTNGQSALHVPYHQ